MSDVVAKIKTYNRGRDPERLAMKLAKMRDDPFIFLRGTCHLFYAGLPEHGLMVDAPHVWACGDLHLENFGSYKGDNRLVYFDINDFDEAALAPCTWDLMRFLVSVQLGVRSLSVNAPETGLLCDIFLSAYASALASGKPRWIERETATGLVRDLLEGLRERTRPQYLDSRTELKGKHRRIRTDGRKALPVDAAQRAQVMSFMQAFAQQQPIPAFFEVFDVARRIAGTGSLGLERYIILIAGKGSPDGNYLLDMKQAVPSSLLPHLKVTQPRWASEAERVVTLQTRLQACPMAFLNAVQCNSASYVLRGLQPSEDRVALDAWHGKRHRLEEVMATMGELTAWAHLRGAGRGSSASADELVAFGLRKNWQPQLREFAVHCAAQVKADWNDYAQAYDSGAFA